RRLSRGAARQARRSRRLHLPLSGAGTRHPSPRAVGPSFPARGHWHPAHPGTALTTKTPRGPITKNTKNTWGVVQKPHQSSRLLLWLGVLVAPWATGSTNAPVLWSFRNHVQPVLAKAGCSSGACHGAAAGQGGFKLSLRGYDDEGDYLTLTRHALVRRIISIDPGRSLMLLKPTGAVPNKVGKKFE